MNTIKDILKLDLNEDIKNVIDLEDYSENETQTEIESYIITDGLGKHLSNFVTQYTSNIKETGVWLSGFYGSGKSYFGKMLGHLIANPMINGTSARDRFILRLKGIANESLIESDIRKLDSIQSKVIFLDVAKQNTDKGLAFTLFANFLKNLGFRDDVYGYIEFDLFLEGKQELLKEKSQALFGKDWDEIKKSNREIAKAMSRIHESLDYTPEEYARTLTVYSDAINNFSSSKLKEELEKYLVKFPDETIVFVFDEASEAISQKKFTLLDLEGISESLSSIGKKVWTIAIAQEKLDDVINNANINKSQLTKVTDRFKTKMHLESTEVDVIIRNRLLLKKEDAFEDLKGYFKKNEGQVNDTTNLKSKFPTKTETAEQFATYYPFHKYQFDVLQKFLFSSNALVASQIAARGMIITTFDVLRKELKNRELFSFTTASDLCDEAQTSPPVELVNKYSNATKILTNEHIDIDGAKLLKTIHFLNEAELVSSTIENITKAYISQIETYYEVKPLIEKALNTLVESKILLFANNNYKITSNLEGKMLEEMKDYDVPLFVKKRELVNYIKKVNIFRPVATINEDTVPYNFTILTDLDDEIIAANNKNLKLTIYSLFNMNGDREDFIESIKLETQFKTDVITLVPDDSKFIQIDRLIEDVKRYTLIDEKYRNDEDNSIKQIIRDFNTIKDEKEKELSHLIENAYFNGSLIYMFDENLLNSEKFKTTINEVQKKLIKNIYTKRLASQLPEAIGAKIVTENNNDKLARNFTSDEFKFFDANGNFVGENLKVVEEINAKIGTKYVDGKSLEEELSIAPWGYSYGTISTTLAVLFRAGRVVVKFNDTEYFSYTDKSAQEIFNSGAKFKTARFKAITKSLTASEKNEIVQNLKDLEFEKIRDITINWNTSDFDLSDAISQLAQTFIDVLSTLKKTQDDFDTIFKNTASQKDVLQPFLSKTTESNYIEKAQAYLQEKDAYAKAINSILKAETFIKKNLSKINGFKRFVDSVENVLVKAVISNSLISEKSIQFNALMKKDVIENFADIQQTSQAIRDEYFALMKENGAKMSALYTQLVAEVESAESELKKYPAELNQTNSANLSRLKEYCTSRVINEIKLEFHINCQESNYSISDILNYIALASTKETELQLIRNSFVESVPKPAEPGKPKEPKKLPFSVPKQTIKVGEYRKLLAAQIQAMAGMDNDDEIVLTIL